MCFLITSIPLYVAYLPLPLLAHTYAPLTASGFWRHALPLPCAWALSSLSSGLGIPREAAGRPLYPAWVVTPHTSSPPLWIPSLPRLASPPCDRLLFPRVFLCSCSDWDLMLDYSSMGTPCHLIRFWRLQARLPLCGHSLHPIWAPAHQPWSSPTEMLSTPCKGCEFSMPGCLFEGAPSLPFWGSKSPFWAPLMNGWPSHPAWGSQYPFTGLPFWPCLRPDNLTSLSCFVDPSSFCSGSDFSCQAKSPCCMDAVLSFLGLWFSLPNSSSSWSVLVFWNPGWGHLVSSLPCSAPPNAFRTKLFRKGGE